MPKEPKPKPDPDYLGNAKANLIAPFNITPAQYTQRLAGAQAQATIALAEQQARTADALETANLIALYSASDLANAIERSKWDHVLNQIKTRLGLA
jgi:hypothetical protein